MSASACLSLRPLVRMAASHGANNTSLVSVWISNHSDLCPVASLWSVVTAPVTAWRPLIETCDAAEVALAVVRAAASCERVVAVDEFTSALDRSAARQACLGMRRLLSRCSDWLTLVVATVHTDIVSFLKPEIVYHAASRQCHLLEWPASSPRAGGAATDASDLSPGQMATSVSDRFARPTINLELRTCSDFPKEGGHAKRMWDSTFKEHHYKKDTLQTGATTDVLRFASTHESVGMVAVVGHFGAPANLPGHTREETRVLNQKMMREHRVVVLPKWQGLGIGPAMSDTAAATWTAHMVDGQRHRYMSTTTHPRFGSYRDSNDKWHPTSGNHKTVEAGYRQFSHEFIGAPHPFDGGTSRREAISGATRR